MSAVEVGLDYLPAVAHAPGVGRYTRELVRALVRLDDPPDLRLFEVGAAPRAIPEEALGLEGFDVVRFRSTTPRRLWSLLARLSGRGADSALGGVDVFQRMLPGWPPVARARTVLAVAELPPAGSRADRELRRDLARTDHLLAFGEAARATIVERTGFAAGRVHVVPVGCDHWARELPEPLPRGEPPVVLVLGALRNEREPLAALAAFERLHARGLEARLLFVGGAGSAEDAFRAARDASPARRAVTWVPNATEEQMPTLVARASALLHLSRGELTAVTPLEALAAGVPVVASRLPAFEEALGDEASWVDDARDATALAHALETALASAADEHASARRRTLAAAFTWERNARTTVEVWRWIASAP